MRACADNCAKLLTREATTTDVALVAHGLLHLFIEKRLKKWGGEELMLFHYNYERPPSGKYCYGKTLMQAFEDSKELALEKNNKVLYFGYAAEQNSQNLGDSFGQ